MYSPRRLLSHVSLSTWSIRLLLIVRSVGIAALLIAVCGSGAWLLRQADQHIEGVVAGALGPVADVGHIQNSYNKSFQAVVHAALMGLPSAVDEAHTAVESDRRDIARYWKALRNSVLARRQAQIIVQAGHHRKAAEQSIDQALKLLDAGQFQLARLTIAGDVQPAFVPLKSDFSNLFAAAVASGRGQAMAQHAADRVGLLYLLCGLGIALLLVGLVDGMIIRSLHRRLAAASQAAARIAEGTLGQGIEVGRDDEIGALLRSMKGMDAQLVAVVGQVRRSAMSVREHSAMVATGSQTLNERTQMQAASLQEAAASMEEMSGSVTQSSDNAQRVDEIARDTTRHAESGHAVALQAATSMQAVETSSQRIAEIAGLIDEVAFQTNLLALNAAVEAAHAGEHGRGFSVVATEVRHLAQRCAAAARDIRGLVDDSVATVGEGSALVGRSGEALTAILAGIRQVSESVATMATSSREQASGIEQVSRAVAQMDQSTHDSAGLVERAAHASLLMQREAEGLLAQVDFFRLPSPEAAKDALARAAAPQSSTPDHARTLRGSVQKTAVLS